MAPTFKNLPFRGLLSSVLPASVMSSLGTTPGSKAVPHLNDPTSIAHWVHAILWCLQGWTSESVTVWRELIGYRLEKAYHCKFTNTHNEHEFIIYEFSNEQHMKLELRADRTVGERKGTLGTGSDSDFSSIDSSDTQSEGSTRSAGSLYFSGRRSSRSSSSIASMKEGISKVSGSLKQVTRRLSDSFVSRPSAFSSNQYLADDRIVRIQGHPKKSEVIRTITFKGDRARWMSLWDIMILIQVVHDDSTMYKLLGRQCYWFADSMFGLLERWSTEHKNGSVSIEPHRKSKWGTKRAQASTGSLGIVLVHRRDDDQMFKLWDTFLKERKNMDAQREGFERRHLEILQKAERSDELMKTMAEKVIQMRKEQEEREQLVRKQEELKKQLQKEQEERERQLKELRRDQEMREQRLKDEQEKREQRLKDEQNEKERRMAREQQVRERRMKEEQELKERRLTGQLRREQEENEQRLKEQFQQQLQDTHLQWQVRFMQAMEENDRRFREITQMIHSNANLNEPTSTSPQILHPQGHS